MKTKVSVEEVKDFISKCKTTVFMGGAKTTILHATLPNGFELVTSASCVDPSEYDQVIGQSICMKRLEEKVWELLGYSLQQARFEVENKLP